MQQVLFVSSRQIQSVTDYIEAVKRRPGEQSKDLPHPRYVYRGQPNIAYSLSPSIERAGFDASLEGRFIEMAKNKRPDEFQTENKLSLLAKMQHYGLPTRLIDFSMNPLVALYFACKNDESDGEVLEFEEQIYRTGKGIPSYISLTFSEPWIPENVESYRSFCEAVIRRYYSHDFQKELILSLAGNIPPQGIDVRNFRSRIVDKSWFKEWECMVCRGSLDSEKQCHVLAALLRCPVFVEAQETLERQRLQQGLFLLIPNQVVENEGKLIIKPNLPQLNVKDSNVGHMIIKAENKKEILKELALIGINEGFLFSDSIDHVCSQIKKSIMMEFRK